MNWDVAGIVAEVVSAIAVVVTLIFLAIEVRNSRYATEAASVDAQSTGVNDLNALIISDPELARIWNVGMADVGQLDDIERLRLALQLQNYINLYIALRSHRETGALPEKNWEYYAHAFGTLMNTPGARELLKEIAVPEEIIQEFAEFRNVEARFAWMPSAMRGGEDAPNKAIESDA